MRYASDFNLVHTWNNVSASDMIVTADGITAVLGCSDMQVRPSVLI